MIWLTVKQHRFEAVAVALACGVLAAAALIEAYRLTALGVPLACLRSWKGPGIPPDGTGLIDAAAMRCDQLASAFFDLRNGLDFRLTQQLTAFVPLAAGIVLGAPMAAREIEQGTAQTSWVHGGSRRPWFAAKILAGVVLLAPLLLAVGLAADALEAAATPTLDPHASFDAYLGRGMIVVFWALAAFTGTFALGAILGRTLPSVIVALAICTLVRLTWDAGMTHLLLRYFAVPQPPRDYSASPYFAPEPDIPITFVYYLDGKPFHGDVYAWYAANDPGGLGAPGPTPPPAASASATPSPEASKQEPPTLVPFVIPGSWYWSVIGLESGFLLLGSLVGAGVAMIRTDGRRPY